MFNYAKFAKIFIATLATEGSQKVTIWQSTKIHDSSNEKSRDFDQYPQIKKLQCC